MSKQVPAKSSDDNLYQLSKEELVEVIKGLQAEIARLQEKLNLDSKTSSKPPSQDIIKKSEKKKSTEEMSAGEPKRKPGGQPGHEGKTRKGFGRVDRIEILHPEVCLHCGGIDLMSDISTVEIQQVAQFVANPIEIVEYHRHQYECLQCGKTCVAPWSDETIPGQDARSAPTSINWLVG
jgi:transposase